MWYTIVAVLHVIVCFFLAIVVLLQQGKGSDVSAVFGGSSQTLFGSSGAGNLLTKLTSASAVIFMITSLTLSYGAARQNTKSLFDSVPATTPTPATAPESVPAAQSGAATESQNTADSLLLEATAPQASVPGESPHTTTAPSASSVTPPPTPAATPTQELSTTSSPTPTTK